MYKDEGAPIGAQEKNERYKKLFPFEDNTPLGQDIALIYIINATIKTAEPWKMVEIGVWAGRTSAVLLTEFNRVTYIGIDPYHGDLSQEKLNWAKARAERVYSDFENGILVRDTSAHAVELFKDDLFDMVFIDGSHKLEDVENDIKLWWPKTKNVMAFHDYETHEGVRVAVSRFLNEKGIADKLKHTFGDVAYIQKGDL